MELHVDVVNIGMGNTRSLKHWLETNNIVVNFVDTPDELRSSCIILPGVGAAKQFMNKIREKKFDDAILRHCQLGGRLLGICLGFQVLLETSEEDGGTKTLGILPGKTVRLESPQTHNGWESIDIDLRKCKLKNCWQGSKPSRRKKFSGRVYYNHEYGILVDQKFDLDIKISKNFEKYSAIIIKDNIMGMQFHPEKSQQSGSDLLRLFF